MVPVLGGLCTPLICTYTDGKMPKYIGVRGGGQGGTRPPNSGKTFDPFGQNETAKMNKYCHNSIIEARITQISKKTLKIFARFARISVYLRDSTVT